MGLDRWLWRPNAFDRVVFATNLHCGRIRRALSEDLDRLDRLGIGEATRRRIFSGNALRLLGLEKKGRRAEIRALLKLSRDEVIERAAKRLVVCDDLSALHQRFAEDLARL